MIHCVAQSLSYKETVAGSRQATANKPRRKVPGISFKPALPEATTLERLLLVVFLIT